MKKNVLVIAAVALVCCVAVCFFWRPVRYRLYPGDRIKGTLTVTVDGVPFALTEENCAVPESGRLLPEEDGAAGIRARGGAYGEYPTVVSLPDGSSLGLGVFQDNWWNVTTFALRAEIDANAGTVHWTGWFTGLNENGKTVTTTVDESRSLPDADGGLLIGV